MDYRTYVSIAEAVDALQTAIENRTLDTALIEMVDLMSAFNDGVTEIRRERAHLMSNIDIVGIIGDITALPERVDVIVNAARPSLLGGGGVDGAIHAAGGRAILDEIKDLKMNNVIGDELPIGEAVITNAGDLNADYVVHTVGPVWRDHTREMNYALLTKAYQNSIKIAEGEWGAESIAFPLISSGAYGWLVEDAVEVAVEAIMATGTKMRVLIVGRTDETIDYVNYVIDHIRKHA